MAAVPHLRTLASNAIAKSLFGPSHPYGHAAIARSSEVLAVTPSSLRRAYESAFDRERATLIVVGDTTAAVLEPKLERAFGAWPRRPAPS